MTNELQVRLTADISALSSALNKAKKTISQFSESSENSGKKVANSYQRATGVIAGLNQKASQLRKNLENATDVKSIVRYNQRLEETTQEITRLNALGRTLGTSTASAAGGFNRLARSQGNANGVAIEFNRIIQDAPFGLIGIGNNIQQLTANFSQVSKSAGGAGAAIKASLSALISPANLLVLGISAVTAAFTAYQLGAFDGLLATKDLREETEKYRESLDSLLKVQLDSLRDADQEIIKLNSLRSIIESETSSRDDKIRAVKQLQEQYPAYFANLTQEQILAGDLQKTYESLTKTLIARASAENAIQRIIDLNDEERVLLEKTQAVRERIAEFEQKRQKQRAEGQSELVTIIENQIRFLQNQNPELQRLKEIEEERNQLTGDVTENLKQANTLLEDQVVISSVNTQEVKEQNDLLLEQFNLYENIFNLAKRNRDALAEAAKGLTGNEGDIAFGNFGIPDTGPPGEREDETNIGISEEELQRIQETNNAILESFSTLGIGISNSLGIANNGLRTFIGTLLSNAPKIIAAIFKQAQANKAAAEIANQANLKQASGNAIVSATETAKGLGPVGLALLPVLIGGALALISSAFGKSAGGVSGGASISTGAPPQIFTNANTLPQSGPSGFGGSIDASNAQGRLSVDIEYDRLRFFLDQGQARKAYG